ATPPRRARRRPRRLRRVAQCWPPSTVRPSIPDLLIALALAAVLAAQAGWAAATTSGTPDETTYLAAGFSIYQRGDAAPLVDERSPARLAMAAAAFGAALAAKYSAVALLPAFLAVLIATDRTGDRARRIWRALGATAAIVVVASTIVWALHGFALLPAKAAIGSRPVPAVLAGIVSQAVHQRGGHPAFLL